jgi:nitroimidazol reductase NimA-like FMN-containing flavoprotein (pyridoxamine 5'-phosphate oxidase superfamily)
MSNEILLHVRHLLETIEHATVATVSVEGQPWNTPVYFARDQSALYWTSRSDAQHSINVRDNGHAFLVIYDSAREDASGAAVYLDASVAELTDEPAVDRALGRIYRRRRKTQPAASRFIAPSVHRVYHATVRRAWTNVLHSAADSPWDQRIEIVFTEV